MLLVTYMFIITYWITNLKLYWSFLLCLIHLDIVFCSKSLLFVMIQLYQFSFSWCYLVYHFYHLNFIYTFTCISITLTTLPLSLNLSWWLLYLIYFFYPCFLFPTFLMIFLFFVFLNYGGLSYFNSLVFRPNYSLVILNM